MYARTIAAGILAATVAAPAALADTPRTVPIYLSDEGHIMADAMVNGVGPFTFIVDTAAGATVVFDDFVEEAGLAELVTPAPIRVQAASGVIDARLVEVGDVEMGEWSFTLSRVIALPTPSHMDDVDGVIGVSQLYGQPVGFALTEGQLEIYEDAQAIDPDVDLSGSWFSVPLERHSDPFMWTTLTINGAEVSAVIDTGARRSVINSAGAEAIGLGSDTAGLEVDEPVRGATEHAQDAWVLPVDTVQLGERVWGGRSLTLSDPDIFTAIGRADRPTIILGSDFLAEQDFIIDAENQVMWMQKRRSAALGFFRQPTVSFSSAAD